MSSFYPKKVKIASIIPTFGLWILKYLVGEYLSYFNIKEDLVRHINRNNKIDKRKTKSSYDEMKEMILDTKTSVNEIRELVGVLSKIRDVKKDKDKESHIELLVEVLAPQKEEIDIEGKISENKTEGPQIKDKIKKLKKVIKEKKNG